MRRVLWAAGVVAASAGVAMGSVAVASPPVTTPVPFQATFPGYTGACDFPITVEFDTNQTQRQWFAPDGTLTRLHVTGGGSVTITNDDNGQSVTVDASGPTLSDGRTMRGNGNWVLIGRVDQASYLPYPPGAWLYSGRIGNLDAASYAEVFRGRITDLCAAVS